MELEKNRHQKETLFKITVIIILLTRALEY